MHSNWSLVLKEPIKRVALRPLFPLFLLFLLVMVAVTSQGCSAEATTTETTSDSPGRIKITGKHAGFYK
jgi:hypothetical protein